LISGAVKTKLGFFDYNHGFITLFFNGYSLVNVKNVCIFYWEFFVDCRHNFNKISYFLELPDRLQQLFRKFCLLLKWVLNFNNINSERDLKKYFKLFIYTAFLLIPCLMAYAQGNFRAEPEVPRVIEKYIKINENKERIAGAKILRCIQTRTSNSGTDTISVSAYNKAGQLLRKITYEDVAGGSGRANFFYLYDNTGKLIQRIDSSSSNVLKSYLEYDEFGGILKEVVKSGSSIVMELSYEYDAMGRLIESIAKDKLQSCKITEKYVYNTYNDLVKLSINNGCGDSDMKTFTNTYNYKYDKSDRIIEKISIPAAGSPLTETFTYDESGELAGGYISSSQTAYTNYKVTVDKSAGTKIAEINQIENELSKTQYRITKFDKFGNPLEVRNEDDRKNLIYRIDYIYEYER